MLDAGGGGGSNSGYSPDTATSKLLSRAIYTFSFEIWDASVLKILVFPLWPLQVSCCQNCNWLILPATSTKRPGYVYKMHWTPVQSLWNMFDIFNSNLVVWFYSRPNVPAFGIKLSQLSCICDKHFLIWKNLAFPFSDVWYKIFDLFMHWTTISSINYSDVPKLHLPAFG